MAATAAALTSILEIFPPTHSRVLLEAQGLLGSLLAIIDLEAKIGSKEQKLMAELLVREIPRERSFIASGRGS